MILKLIRISKIIKYTNIEINISKLYGVIRID